MALEARAAPEALRKPIPADKGLWSKHLQEGGPPISATEFLKQTRKGKWSEHLQEGGPRISAAEFLKRTTETPREPIPASGGKWSAPLQAAAPTMPSPKKPIASIHTRYGAGGEVATQESDRENDDATPYRTADEARELLRATRARLATQNPGWKAMLAAASAEGIQDRYEDAGPEHDIGMGAVGHHSSPIPMDAHTAWLLASQPFETFKDAPVFTALLDEYEEIDVNDILLPAGFSTPPEYEEKVRLLLNYGLDEEFTASPLQKQAGYWEDSAYGFRVIWKVEMPTISTGAHATGRVRRDALKTYTEQIFRNKFKFKVVPVDEDLKTISPGDGDSARELHVRLRGNVTIKQHPVFSPVRIGPKLFEPMKFTWSYPGRPWSLHGNGVGATISQLKQGNLGSEVILHSNQIALGEGDEGYGEEIPVAYAGDESHFGNREAAIEWLSGGGPKPTWKRYHSHFSGLGNSLFSGGGKRKTKRRKTKRRKTKKRKTKKRSKRRRSRRR